MPAADRFQRAGRSVVLGPQVGQIALGEGLEALDPPAGPIADITVGWRETEPVRREVDREIAGFGRTPAPLLIGERVGRAFAADPELRAAHRELQDGMLADERLYRVRLRQAVDAAHQIQGLPVEERYRRPYAEAAWEAILAADRMHLERHAALWGAFHEVFRPEARPALRREKEEIEEILAGAAAVVLTGGHVAVIRNRLRLLDLGPALARLPVLAWSAGAMVLTPRVVLFHDRLPHGSVHPEILGEGLSVLTGVAFFPDAGTRLDQGDRLSLTELAGRVAPETPVLLDPGDRLVRDGSRWSGSAGVRVLEADGRVETVPELVVGAA